MAATTELSQADDDVALVVATAKLANKPRRSVERALDRVLEKHIPGLRGDERALVQLRALISDGKTSYAILVNASPRVVLRHFRRTCDLGFMSKDRQALALMTVCRHLLRSP